MFVYSGSFKNLRGLHIILLLLIQHTFPQHLVVQGAVLGIAGSTETSNCWPSWAHIPTGIMIRILGRKKGYEKQLGGERLALAERREDVCIYIDAEFSPVLSLSMNTGKEPDYGLSVPSQPVLFILRPWVLGEVQAQLRIHICGVCSTLPSLLGGRRELGQSGGRQKPRGPSSLSLAPSL